ncbi:hypothetical protein D018_3593B, partial [Vibrio parahaemolyticus VP2007-007]
TAYQKLSTNAA